SRSGLVAAAYLMYEHGWTRDEALAFLRTKHPQVRPNPGFMRLLAEWEQHLKGRAGGGGGWARPRAAPLRRFVLRWDFRPDPGRLTSDLEYDRPSTTLGIGLHCVAPHPPFPGAFASGVRASRGNGSRQRGIRECQASALAGPAAPDVVMQFLDLTLPS